ncbi:MAG: DUF4390 domain-containing protein [bacterium]
MQGKLIVTITALMLVLGSVMAEIRHKEVVLYLQEEMISLDLAEEYELNETQLEALQNGVPLVFLTEIRMRRDGAYLWEGYVAEIDLRNKLEYYPLSGLYEVHRLEEDTREAFTSLDAALTSLGLMQGVSIISRTDIDTTPHYMVTVQTNLDVSELPAPLRPAAYVLPRWKLQSKIWEWRLKP